MKATAKVITVLIASLTLLGCPNETESSNSTASKVYQATREDIALLYQDIDALISDKSCQASTDCELVALGARACGGPDSYEVYSKINTDVKKLNLAAKQLEELQKTYNQENQMMSICMMEPKPEVSCKQNQCQKQKVSNLIQ